jgi:hypothetical protein
MSLHRRGATASVRRNLLRHEFAQARGDRNEFRSTCRRAGRPQAFAEIYCGMSSHRRGATEMNFGLHAGARGDRNEFRSTYRRGVTEMNFGLHAGARGDRNEFRSTYRHGATASVRRNLLRHEFAQARGDRNEFRSTCRHGVTASVRRNLFRHEFAQARGDRKRSPKFIAA